MTTHFTPGRWYSWKDQVRPAYDECGKGILLGRKNGIAVIVNVLGIPRKQGGDAFDGASRCLTCVVEGKAGDPKETPRDLALSNAEKSGSPIRVFLDCGNLFSPKKLLHAGEWHVRGKDCVSVGGRTACRHRLEPDDPVAADHLAFAFGVLGANDGFESDLKAFAAARKRLHAQHGSLVKSGDNIAEGIGTYYAIKEFNLKHPAHPLIRLSGAHKDIDAIQAGTGTRFAIKTIGNIPSMTSNIWSKNIVDSIDAFLVTYLDRDLLEPIRVFIVTVSQAEPFLKKDQYQGCRKLRVDDNLIRISKTIFASN